MKIIDAHSHIEYITHDFQPDIVGTICCAKNESEWDALCNIMKSDNRVYGAFGVHPWFVSNVQDDFEQRLEQLLLSNSKYMMGEIGLDKYKPDMEKQIDVLVKQLNIAVKLKRNIFLHCVGAWDKILHILKQYKKSELPTIIVHGFNGGDAILQNLLDNYNVIFSVSDTRYVNKIPNNKILVETDAKSNIILKDLINEISDIKYDLNIGNIIYNNSLGIINNE